MKRFFLLILSLWRLLFGYYFSAAVIGALVGFFVFSPIYEFVYFYEISDLLEGQWESESVLEHVMTQLKNSLRGESPEKTVFITGVGVMFGLTVAWIHSILHARLQQIQRLSRELDVDLLSLIAQGESQYLEFKSSYRWDLVEQRINRNLENVVLKTIAGYLNSHDGGTLLIGVADDGQILGLRQDYQALKRADQDGFEQAIVTAISTQLGADLCRFVKVLFHVIEQRDVCRLIILPAFRPVFLQQGKEPKFYLRTGGGTRDLNIKEAVEFILHRWPR